MKSIIDYFAYVIWYINDNFIQSLLLSFAGEYAANKVIVRLTYLEHFKRSLFYLNLIGHFTNCVLILYFGTLCFKFVSVISFFSENRCVIHES